MVEKAENVSEGMSSLWGVYADSKPVLRYSNKGQAGTIECTVVGDWTQVLMYSSRTDQSTMCAPQISVDIFKFYCKLEPTNLQMMMQITAHLIETKCVHSNQQNANGGSSLPATIWIYVTGSFVDHQHVFY